MARSVCLLLLLFFCWLSTAHAQDAEPASKEIDATVLTRHPRVTVQFSRTPLLLALRLLTTAADGRAFAENRSPVPLPDLVSGTFTDWPFEEVLRSILKQARQPMSYRLEPGSRFLVRPGRDFPKRLLWAVYTRDEEEQLTFDRESSRPTPFVQIGHTRSVRWLGFSPGGRHLASASDDGTIYIWDMNGRRLLRTLAGTTGGAGFTEKGKALVSAASTFMLQWRTGTGYLRQRRNNIFGGLIESFAVHKNGTVITAGTDGSVRTFATFRDQARILIPPRRGHYYRAGITADGSLVYAYLNRITEEETDEEKNDPNKYSTVYFWQANTERFWTKIRSQDGGRIRQVAMSPDRRLILLATDRGAVEIRSVTNSMMQLKSIPADTNDIQLVFNAAGTRLYIGTRNGVAIWNVSDRFAQIANLRNVGSCRALAISEDERFLAVGSDRGQVSVWDAKKQTPVVAFAPMAESVEEAFFTSDGSRMVTLGGGTGRLWDIGMTRLPEPIPAILGNGVVHKISPQKDQIAVANNKGGVTLLANSDFKSLHDLVPINAPRSGRIENLDWNRQGNRVIGAGFGGVAYVWDAATGDCVAGPFSLGKDGGGGGRVNYLALAGDNKTLVVRYQSGTVGIWDITDPGGVPLHEISPKPAAAAKPVPSAAPPPETDPAELESPTGAEGAAKEEKPAEPWQDFPVEVGDFDVGYDARTGLAYLAVTRNVETLLYKIRDGQYIRTCEGFAPKFDPRGRYLLVSSGSTLKVHDIATGQVVDTVSNVGGNAVFSTDGRLLAVSNLVGFDSRPLITVLDATGRFSRLARLSGHTGLINSVCFSPDNKRLLSGAQDGSTRLWDVVPDPPKTIPKRGEKVVPKAAREYEIAAFMGVRGTKGADEYAVVSPDGYYMASKGALGKVAFRFGDSTYSFDQFDLRLNRPDIVLSRLGRAPAPLIASLQSAYRMRMHKMGITNAAATGATDALDKPGLGNADLQLPTVELKQPLPVSVTGRDLSFTVSASDAKTELSALLISVNDVPLGGTRGRDISAKHAKSTEETVALRLMPGMNKIQISVRNGVGVESLRETEYVTCQTVAPTPRLYVLAVGVSRYKNSEYDLAVADKDARELVAFFAGLNRKTLSKPKVLPKPALKVQAKKSPPARKTAKRTPPRKSRRAIYTPRYRPLPRTVYPLPSPVPATAGPLLPLYGTRYGEVFTRVLTNEEATNAAIRQTAETFLADAREEDHVILFFAGHGKIDLRDKNQTYYFLTHEADGADLTNTALPYTELEGILDRTAARQRLVLLDTCESGDIYLDPLKLKEVEARIAAERAKSARPVADSVPLALNSAGVSGLMRGLPGESLTEDDAATLVRDLFADLRRSMGAEVITAATGMQKALERGGNGVFTRALIQVLQKGKGQPLPVSALRNQVAEIVRKETKNQQIPVMRAESVDFDFPILLGTP